MKRNKLGYIYKVSDESGNFYVGKRFSNKEPLEDPYMGSFTDENFSPLYKVILEQDIECKKKLAEAEIFFIKKYINSKNCINKKIFSMVGQEQGILTWITNGVKDKQHRVDKEIPVGWKKGRSSAFLRHPTKGTFQWIKNGNVRRCEECPGQGWQRGSYYNGSNNLDPEATKGMNWYTNGITNKLLKEEEDKIPHGYYRGRISNFKKRPSKKIEVKYVGGNTEVFDSLDDLQKSLPHINCSKIGSVCNGNRKLTKAQQKVFESVRYKDRIPKDPSKG
jgi:hypothetical protein